MHDRVSEHGDIGVAGCAVWLGVDDEAQYFDHLLLEAGAEFLDDGRVHGGVFAALEHAGDGA